MKWVALAERICVVEGAVAWDLGRQQILLHNLIIHISLKTT